MDKMVIRNLILAGVISLIYGATGYSIEQPIIKCTDDLSSGAKIFLQQLENNTLLVGFNDGEIHKMELSTNELDIMTATYMKKNGEVIYNNMELSECINKADGSKYIQAYKDTYSRIGEYKYPAMILIPLTSKLFEENSDIYTYTDLRFGQWEKAKILMRYILAI